jgi:uncharacterized protein (TIGR02246 family)
MRQLLASLGAVMVLSGAATAASSSAQTASADHVADAAAIRAIVDHWRQTWDTFDASPLRNDYADDADWLNAFGTRFKGSADILKFMTAVVKRPSVKDRHTTWDEPKIRFVRADVALATRDYKTIGHKTPDGHEMPERHTHSTWLLTKQQGVWRIVSQVISDDNGAG